eukprot:7904389-Alexandrium_andersonii.AAC.1
MARSFGGGSLPEVWLAAARMLRKQRSRAGARCRARRRGSGARPLDGLCAARLRDWWRRRRLRCPRMSRCR